MADHHCPHCYRHHKVQQWTRYSLMSSTTYSIVVYHPLQLHPSQTILLQFHQPVNSGSVVVEGYRELSPPMKPHIPPRLSSATAADSASNNTQLPSLNIIIIRWPQHSRLRLTHNKQSIWMRLEWLFIAFITTTHYGPTYARENEWNSTHQPSRDTHHQQDRFSKRTPYHTYSTDAGPIQASTLGTVLHLQCTLFWNKALTIVVLLFDEGCGVKQSILPGAATSHVSILIHNTLKYSTSPRDISVLRNSHSIALLTTLCFRSPFDLTLIATPATLASIPIHAASYRTLGMWGGWNLWIDLEIFLYDPKTSWWP